ncbi:hypothetical protein BN13_40049 [Nostocoides jenkinsii Ben 74]|uniref:Uncharacterized protein n=1 Tax=Nostocoides jenkinsii Ben 74 TaxID=1193518 RepID=A0A077MES0_9MICO|nr:hypothetical protein BN13_40049 [Tetrasphaera jenkinsii Ben 74]
MVMLISTKTVPNRRQPFDIPVASLLFAPAACDIRSHLHEARHLRARPRHGRSPLDGNSANPCFTVP